jgi:dienelactone hydrolase
MIVEIGMICRVGNPAAGWNPAPPRTVILALALAVIGGAVFGQPLKPGPQVLTFFSEVDDSDQPYGLYLPKNYDGGKKYPLVISLHGAYSNHRLNLRRVFGKSNLLGETEAEATRYFPALRDVDFIVATPLARGTLGYAGLPEKDVYDVLADVQRRFSVDEDRIYLTGLSMGGGGTLWLGLTRPDIWAAIAAVCPVQPREADLFAPNALNLPVHLFHGDADPVVPVTVSRSWKQRLDDLDTRTHYTEYRNVRHNSWENAYKDGAIFDWFAQFQRNRFPDRVRFATDRYEYRSAYWIAIEALTPGRLAEIDARFTAPNAVEVKTEGLDGFSLDITRHPRYAAARPLRLTIDGARVTLARRGALQFVRGTAGWKQGSYKPAPMEKRPGVEGPIPRAIAARHIYVYGTAGSPTEEELNERRELAARAAEWGSPRMRLLTTFRVMTDSEVRPSDYESANMILFGTKETNTQIARLAAKLPLELNAGAADYGLVYIYPNGNRYVVINSGLPWWSGTERMRPSAFGYLPPSYAILTGLQDFVLFRGTIDDVVSSGYFDRNWRVPAEAARTIEETGAVKLNP